MEWEGQRRGWWVRRNGGLREENHADQSDGFSVRVFTDGQSVFRSQGGVSVHNHEKT